MKAVFIHLALPDWSMSCEDCREWIHENGHIKMSESQIPLPVRRPPNHSPPCRRCPKVPEKIQKDDTPRKWEHAADLAGEIETVYQHYRKCRVIGRFPEDELVEEFAILIADAEQRADRRRRDSAEVRLDFLVERLTRRQRE